MFSTKFNVDISKFISCSGTKVVECDKTSGERVEVFGRRYTYKLDYNKKGRRHLIKSGTEDVYQYIQSFKDDTDIYKIVARYFNGDITALDRNKGFYADITQIPQSFNEWHNKIEEGQHIFAGLPTDLKSEFGNNISEFMVSIYNNDFEKRFNDYVSRKTNRFVNNVGNVDNGSVEKVGGNSNE